LSFCEKAFVQNISFKKKSTENRKTELAVEITIGKSLTTLHEYISNILFNFNEDKYDSLINFLYFFSFENIFSPKISMIFI
jgi:hypothetical protein